MKISLYMTSLYAGALLSHCSQKATFTSGQRPVKPQSDAHGQPAISAPTTAGVANTANSDLALAKPIEQNFDAVELSAQALDISGSIKTNKSSQVLSSLILHGQYNSASKAENAKGIGTTFTNLSISQPMTGVAKTVSITKMIANEFDVLAIIQNTPTMAKKIPKLAANIDKLVAALGTAKWRIAVNVTDNYTLGTGACVIGSVASTDVDPTGKLKALIGGISATGNESQRTLLSAVKSVQKDCAWRTTGRPLALFFYADQDIVDDPIDPQLDINKFYPPVIGMDYYHDRAATIGSIYWLPNQSSDQCPDGIVRGANMAVSLSSTISVAASICDSDYSAFFTSLMRNAVGLTKPFGSSGTLTVKNVASAFDGATPIKPDFIPVTAGGDVDLTNSDPSIPVGRIITMTYLYSDTAPIISKANVGRSFDAISVRARNYLKPADPSFYLTTSEYKADAVAKLVTLTDPKYLAPGWAFDIEPVSFVAKPSLNIPSLIVPGTLVCHLGTLNGGGSYDYATAALPVTYNRENGLLTPINAVNPTDQIQCSYDAPNDPKLAYNFVVTDAFQPLVIKAEDATSKAPISVTYDAQTKQVVFPAAEVYNGRVVNLSYQGAVTDQSVIHLDFPVAPGSFKVKIQANGQDCASTGAWKLADQDLTIGSICYPYQSLHVDYLAIKQINTEFEMPTDSIGELHSTKKELLWTVRIDGEPQASGWTVNTASSGIKLDKSIGLHSDGSSPIITVRVEVVE